MLSYLCKVRAYHRLYTVMVQCFLEVLEREKKINIRQIFVFTNRIYRYIYSRYSGIGEMPIFFPYGATEFPIPKILIYDFIMVFVLYYKIYVGYTL